MNNLPVPHDPNQILEDYFQNKWFPEQQANNLPANFDGYGIEPARRDVPLSTVDYNKLAKGAVGLAAGAGVLAVGIAAVKAAALAVVATIMANPGTTTLVFLGGTIVLWLSACRNGGEEARKDAGGAVYNNNVTVNIINGNQQQ